MDTHTPMTIADPTPEAIRAGVKAWLSFDARFEEPDDVVVRIWRAMWTAQRNDLTAEAQEAECPPHRLLAK